MLTLLTTLTRRLAHCSCAGRWVSADQTSVILSLSLGFLGSVLPVTADVVSEAVGYVDIRMLRDSDTTLAVPLSPGIEFTGTIGAITPGTAGHFGAQLSVTPGFLTDQFKDFYYVRMKSGTRRGMYFTIVGQHCRYPHP